MPFSSSPFEETNQRLSLLLDQERDRSRLNLDRLRRNIAAAESPAEGHHPRPLPPPPSRPMESPMPPSRETQRLAQVRLTLPIPGSYDFGDSILDRVAANYAKLRRK
jgi:hypothetical protein